MRVLVACEMSGRVREAFTARGHEAVSCDLLPDVHLSSQHVEGDIRDLLRKNVEWDLMIAFPPCTGLAVSGARYFKKKQQDGRQKEALDFVRFLMNAPIPRIAIENPIGIISSHIRKPDQIIQPYQFGEDASKRTCLWLKGLPLLVPTQFVAASHNGRWANQTPSGQNKLGPSPDRALIRSLTYQGIAAAMAEQWGGLAE